MTSLTGGFLIMTGILLVAIIALRLLGAPEQLQRGEVSGVARFRRISIKFKAANKTAIFLLIFILASGFTYAFARLVAEVGVAR
jgi:hypothetical protein